MNGRVFLVGAGPGDPKLLTRRGLEILQSADCVVYDALIGAPLLREARPDAELIFVGKRAGAHSMAQEQISALLVEKARQGKSVCRLKGGDPFVFGRGGEEALECARGGIAFEIVPGVSSAVAAPAYAGIPVTHREIATSYAVVTGHTASDDAPPEELPDAQTLVFLMGVRALGRIVERLRAAGRPAQTPVALVRWGTTPLQQTVVGTLDNIEARVAEAGLGPPALIVVGEVVRLRDELRWFDTRPLWGQSVVVTRAREQASELVSLLEAAGARVLECPTIRVEELSETPEWEAVRANWGAFDWAVFTSTNGVQAFWRKLREGDGDARALGGVQIAAIGPATRDALQARGLFPDFVPDSSVSEEVARGLLERGAGGAGIVIFRALAGRDALARELEAGGARVQIVPLYRTLPDASQAPAARDAVERGEVNWVTFTSSSTVRNFVEAMGAEWVAQNRARFRVAVIGPVTQTTASECGLVPDLVAPTASVEALAEALLQREA